MAGLMEGLVEAFGVTLAMGLPIAAALVVMGVVVDRLLRAAERRGFILHPRYWSTTGVGNALLEFHVAFEPDKARIETRIVEERAEEGIGDRRENPPSAAANVIPIDFVRRQRR